MKFKLSLMFSILFFLPFITYASIEDTVNSWFDPLPTATSMVLEVCPKISMNLLPDYNNHFTGKLSYLPDNLTNRYIIENMNTNGNISNCPNGGWSVPIVVNSVITYSVKIEVYGTKKDGNGDKFVVASYSGSPGLNNRITLNVPDKPMQEAPKATNPDDEESGTEEPSAPAASGDSTTPATETKDDQPLSALLGKSESIIPKIIGTKDCTTGKYTSGILKGLTCSGAAQGNTGLMQVIQVIKNIINDILLPISGVVFTIMFIFGGIIYITSAGNDTRIQAAKKTLTAAIVGLLIVVLAYAIIGIFVTIIGGSIA